MWLFLWYLKLTYLTTSIPWLHMLPGSLPHYFSSWCRGSVRTWLYKNSAEADLGGEEHFCFPLATIAHFDCHWQYMTTSMFGTSRKLAAHKQPGDELGLRGQNQSDAPTRWASIRPKVHYHFDSVLKRVPLHCMIWATSQVETSL